MPKFIMFQSLGQYHILKSMTVGLFYVLFSAQFTIRENGIGMFHYHFDGHQGALCVLKWGILQAKLFFNPTETYQRKVHRSEIIVPLQAADQNLEAITVFVAVFLQH